MFSAVGTSSVSAIRGVRQVGYKLCFLNSFRVSTTKARDRVNLSSSTPNTYETNVALYLDGVDAHGSSNTQVLQALLKLGVCALRNIVTIMVNTDDSHVFIG